MSLPVDREFITQTFIALGVCLGGWMFFVQPKVEELHALDTEIAYLKSKGSTLTHEHVERVAEQAPILRKRSAEIEAAGEFAQDTSLLYGRVMDLAQIHGVRVQNLRPGEQKSTKDKTITITRIDMTAEGEYESIATFLDDLNDVGAFLRPTSVQIAPTNRTGGSHTVMQLGFDAFQFHLPKIVVQLNQGSGQ